MNKVKDLRTMKTLGIDALVLYTINKGQNILKIDYEDGFYNLYIKADTKYIENVHRTSSIEDMLSYIIGRPIGHLLTTKNDPMEAITEFGITDKRREKRVYKIKEEASAILEIIEQDRNNKIRKIERTE